MGNCLISKSGTDRAQMDLLWTNPNPTSEFAAQTIQLDLSGYKSILFICQGSYANLDYFSTFVGLIGESVEMSCPFKDTGDTSGKVYFGERIATISSNSIEFSGGKAAILGTHTT